jgi:hypothetical protein
VAEYWTEETLTTSNTPAHAIDLLICIVIASPSASRLIESLQGEEMIRNLMEKHTIGPGDSRKRVDRRAMTLEEVQDNPLAIKCAEFLLFLEYRSEEVKGKGNNDDDEASVLLNDSIRSVVGHSHPRRSRLAAGAAAVSVSAASSASSSSSSTITSNTKRIERRHDRGRSSSPIKGRTRREEAASMRREEARKEDASARREERIRIMKSRPIQTQSLISTTSQDRQELSPLVRTPIHSSPMVKSAPASRETWQVKTSLTPFVKSTSTSPRKLQHTRRGRSRERSPLVITQATAATVDSPTTTSSSFISSTNSSPLKAIMGPSPAVQRAQARSVSPVKKRFMHSGTTTTATLPNSRCR